MLIICVSNTQQTALMETSLFQNFFFHEFSYRSFIFCRYFQKLSVSKKKRALIGSFCMNKKLSYKSSYFGWISLMDPFTQNVYPTVFKNNWLLKSRNLFVLSVLFTTICKNRHCSSSSNAQVPVPWLESCCGL